MYINSECRQRLFMTLGKPSQTIKTTQLEYYETSSVYSYGISCYILSVIVLNIVFEAFVRLLLTCLLHDYNRLYRLDLKKFLAGEG